MDIYPSVCHIIILHVLYGVKPAHSFMYFSDKSHVYLSMQWQMCLFHIKHEHAPIVNEKCIFSQTQTVNICVYPSTIFSFPDHHAQTSRTIRQTETRNETIH